MAQTLFPQSAQSRANLSAEQRDALEVRSDMVELIAVTRNAIAQLRILIAEADTLIARSKRCKLGTVPQSEKDTLSDRI